MECVGLGGFILILPRLILAGLMGLRITRRILFLIIFIISTWFISEGIHGLDFLCSGEDLGNGLEVKCGELFRETLVSKSSDELGDDFLLSPCSTYHGPLQSVCEG